MDNEKCFNLNCNLPRYHSDECSAPTSRDCKHGRLARSCGECEAYRDLFSARNALIKEGLERDEAIKFLEWFMPLIEDSINESIASSGEYSNRESKTMLLRAKAFINKVRRTNG